MFRAKSLIQQQLRRSSWLLRPGAIVGAGSLAYLAHQSEQQQQQQQEDDVARMIMMHGKQHPLEGLALPRILEPTVTLCEEETVRQQREREITTIRDMLLENPNLKPKQYKKGHVLHREGGLDKGLCIVLDGEISLSTGRLSVSRKHKGDIFGALSLVSEGYGPRRFTARCISPECTIVEIGQEEFDEAIAAHPELKKGLRDICLCQEFQRLVVLHTKNHFPRTRDAMKYLFHSIKYSAGTELQLLDVQRVIRSMDRKKTNEDIEDIFAAMDVDGNGGLSVDEFEALFWEI